MFSRGMLHLAFMICTIWLDQFQNFSLNSLLPEALLTINAKFEDCAREDAERSRRGKKGRNRTSRIVACLSLRVISVETLQSMLSAVRRFNLLSLHPLADSHGMTKLSSNGNPHASSSRFLQAHSQMSREQRRINRMGMSHRGRICGTEFGRST